MAEIRIDGNKCPFLPEGEKPDGLVFRSAHACLKHGHSVMASLAQSDSVRRRKIFV